MYLYYLKNFKLITDVLTDKQQSMNRDKQQHLHII